MDIEISPIEYAPLYQDIVNKVWQSGVYKSPAHWRHDRRYLLYPYYFSLLNKKCFLQRDFVHSELLSTKLRRIPFLSCYLPFWFSWWIGC
jgi:hypothetical protein